LLLRLEELNTTRIQKGYYIGSKLTASGDAKETTTAYSKRLPDVYSGPVDFCDEPKREEK